jgi:molybdopterin/thiamine biosynthesis adenylyltransferase/rhodanese-related sulfurtransferase
LHPHDIHKRLNTTGFLLLDVRDTEDQLGGISDGARCMSSADLSQQHQQLAQRYETVVLMCYHGNTSAVLCQRLGAPFISAQGGFAAWESAGLPVVKPTLNTELLRYQQQIKLAGFGSQSQQRLGQARVLVVGAGGLGSPALLYLAAAGVGHITLMDDDQVSLTNLHRQVLYTEADVGLPKARQAALRMSALNASIEVEALPEALHQKNAEAIIAAVDLVIDGSDNLHTRYLINQVCLAQSKPWIYAAVSGFDVQVAMFGLPGQQLCYRCVFGDLEEQDAPNCSREGVLGPVPGFAAMIQVTEAIKYLAQLGHPLSHGLLTHNLLNHQSKVLKYPPNQSCTHR